ncbi:hypothetical protein CVT26_006959 [Gymnopilus dilepis]|uniref:Uncharacterized protein n=1 Tax=Gymnopilus dilepis TaxID=231916 RepID=A0A409W679_9AGAR|nr:hypothetical protein CVT26_006959 [Gymnopilus dilepis]
MILKRTRDYLRLIALDKVLSFRRETSRVLSSQNPRYVVTAKRIHTEAKVPEYYEGRLEGTAPDHLCYILLHSPHSPETFPSVHHTPVSRELQLRAKKWGGLVNFSWLADRKVAGDSAESHAATVFSPLGGKLDIPKISVQNMDEVEELIRRHIEGPLTSSTSEDMQIYVCTHGARDCRCGDRGRQVYEALVKAVKDEEISNPTGPTSRLKIGEVGHGEWLGIIKPEDAPSIVAAACEALRSGVKPLGPSTPPIFPSHWRGRMGLSREDQTNLWLRCTGHNSPTSTPWTRESEGVLTPLSRRLG